MRNISGLDVVRRSADRERPGARGFRLFEHHAVDRSGNGPVEPTWKAAGNRLGPRTVLPSECGQRGNEKDPT